MTVAIVTDPEVAHTETLRQTAVSRNGLLGRAGSVIRELHRHRFLLPFLTSLLIIGVQMAVMGVELAPLVWPVVAFETFTMTCAISTAVLMAPRGWLVRDRFQMRLATTFAIIAVNSVWYTLTFPGLGDGNAFSGRALVRTDELVSLVFALVDFSVLPIGIAFAAHRADARTTDSSPLRHGMAVATMAVFGVAVVVIGDLGVLTPLAFATDHTRLTHLIAFAVPVVVVVYGLRRLWPLTVASDSGPDQFSNRWIARALVWCLAFRLASLIGAEMELVRFNAGWFIFRIVKCGAFLSVVIAQLHDGYRLFRIEREQNEHWRDLGRVLAGLGAARSVAQIHRTSVEWLEAVFACNVVSHDAGFDAAVGSHRIALFPISDPVSGRALAIERSRPFSVLERNSIDAFISSASMSFERARIHEDAAQVKDDFFNMIGHELRTPLTSVVGYATLLRDQLADDDGSVEESREFVERLHVQAEDLSRLIQGLFDAAHDLGGVGVPEPVAVDLVTRARAVVGAHARSAAERDIAFHVIPADVTCLAVPQLVDRILGAVVQNAIQYINVGGRVTITSGVHDQVATASGLRAMVTCTISDDGPGLTVEEQGRLFTPFSRALGSDSQPVRGAGLGLYVAQRLAGLMHGRVTSQSELGSGSSFTLHLPAYLPVVQSSSAQG